MARDVNRMPEILDLLSQAWYKYPDFRLIQLIQAISTINSDLYYLEDDKLKEYLERFLEDNA